MELQPTVKLDVASDSRRKEFNHRNETILTLAVPVHAVFIGDSITHWWELGAFFGGSGRLLVNRGIGGDVSAHVVRRFEADVLQLNPKLAVVLIGINDTGAIREAAEEELPLLVETLTERLVANAAALMNISRAKGIRMAVGSLLPTSHYWKTRNNVRNQAIIGINRRIRQEAERQPHVVYVDYHSRMVGEDGVALRSGLSHDGLHPHVLGYAVMAEVLKETLRGRGIEL
ncbi:G-D-S-L family lipolytic protein [Paenibacillus mesophilus]|uniref:GDSL-type esterase/lipase family protein n=1 Tax=Paenibacillus mesophilus TaxID=2582849 RepID=UPI00110E97AE|nr:GDSL-type esterase/lipase family protein [Paenibacillus mesophilus]TMV46872.1 G-D-S-L family lipolytic protein [Paenibacillus mesophilus]